MSAVAEGTATHAVADSPPATSITPNPSNAPPAEERLMVLPCLLVRCTFFTWR